MALVHIFMTADHLPIFRVPSNLIFTAIILGANRFRLKTLRAERVYRTRLFIQLIITSFLKTLLTLREELAK
jgi:hypothetical protein